MMTSLPCLGQELTLSEKVIKMEKRLEAEFETYFEENLADVTQSPEEIARTLGRIGEETGTRPAVLWVMPRKTHLHLVLITPNGKPIARDLYDVPKRLLLRTAEQFHNALMDSSTQEYKTYAQQLYKWMIAPYEAEFLETAKIDTLLVCLGQGVRGLPLSALHDGEKFLIEKYSITRIPAFNLISTEYKPIASDKLLAMGVSEFESFEPLPAVPLELSNITASNQERSQIAQPVKKSWLNQDATLDTLKIKLQERSYDIVHLATHAQFQPGQPTNSFIQLWDKRLTLKEMRDLDWSANVELLVLSACETAVGDRNAELGFAGLALNADVKSAIASLWTISDVGTLALISEFYRQLPQSKTKAQALRQAQLQMLNQSVRIETDSLRVVRGEQAIDELQTTAQSFAHPFYWAGFSMISSPW
ncbi:MAG: CHAT domain-containing protein [Microcystaceae cyanobacterium]